MANQEILHLNQVHLNHYRKLMKVFSEAFDDSASYEAKPPSDAYAENLLSKSHIIHLVATDNQVVIGGLVAYVLAKFEQERAEVYIYDLAVAESHRRQGIATRLIEELKKISKNLGAWVIFVQADYEDPPAQKLYESLGQREEVLHYDIHTDS